MLRSIQLAATAAVLLSAMPASADTTVADAGAEPDAMPPFYEDVVAGGKHWRFETKNGPVHVWRPPGYWHPKAGIVVYVHGFWTNVDEAWTEHKLAEQFLASKQNALFIVPEAPSRLHAPLHWRSLGDLIREVRRQTKLKRPWGHVVVMGHSGAYRSITLWLDFRHLTHLILLDAMYGREEQFRRWVYNRRRNNRLMVIAADTLRVTEPWIRRQKNAVTMDLIPEFYEDFRPPEKKAKLLYMRSQFEHMDIVTQGKVIPIALRLTRLGKTKYRRVAKRRYR
jgi:hypothetical protein